MELPFAQVDVFTDTPFRGNPVAVVLNADGLSTEAMQRIANWTNLSETTFLLEPTRPDADYRARIFTPSQELPFAGHPTLGSCHAWVEHTGSTVERMVQECGAGLVPVRRIDAGYAFAAPPRTRSGPVEESTLLRVAAQLRVPREGIVDAQWAVNGPEWVAIMLDSAEAVLSVQPGVVDMDIGLVGPHPAGAPWAYELRAFFPKNGATAEDPVTGSLHASVAQWLFETGQASAPYLARQGTALGRDGLAAASTADGDVWIGGGTVTGVNGTMHWADTEHPGDGEALRCSESPRPTEE